MKPNQLTNQKSGSIEAFFIKFNVKVEKTPN